MLQGKSIHSRQNFVSMPDSGRGAPCVRPLQAILAFEFEGDGLG